MADQDWNNLGSPEDWNVPGTSEDWNIAEATLSPTDIRTWYVLRATRIWRLLAAVSRVFVADVVVRTWDISRSTRVWRLSSTADRTWAA